MRDVWLFVIPGMIRAAWDRLQRHLGRSRAMWAYLLELTDTPWPPPLSFLQAVQRVAPFHLGGGAARAGAR
jgi:hypothetical protein